MENNLQNIEIFYVIKRDGSKEEFKFNKIQRMLLDCAKDLDIDLNLFAQNFMIKIRPGITTAEIQKRLIEEANELLLKDKNNPYNTDWSKFANRLFLSDFQKQLRIQRGGYNKTTKNALFKDENEWIEHLKKYTFEIPVYNRHFYEKYLTSKEGVEYLKSLYRWVKNQPITVWDNFFYQSLKVLSYLTKYEGKYIETPEEMQLLMSIAAFGDDVNKVKKFYKYLSHYYIIPATPQLLNLRKAKGGLSSCNIFQIEDNLDSIMNGVNALAQISKRAGGVGIYLGRLRPSGSQLMNQPNATNHINVQVKIFNQVVVAVNQGALRKGACTIALPIWHKDIVEFINMRNPVGEERLKAFDIFPQVVIPNFFMEYLKDNKTFYLIDHYEVRKIDKNINLFDKTGEELKRDYEKIVNYIQEGKLKNYIAINARDLAKEIFKNWAASGLPYVFFEDNVNNQSQFKEKIHCGNLCMENFSPFPFIDDDHFFIHSCNLISLNLPKLDEDEILFDDKKLFDVVNITVEYMNNLFNYSIPFGKEIYNLEGIVRHNEEYRTIGIGFIGLADLIAKYNLSYRPKKRGKKEETIKFFDKIFGRIALFAVRASLDYDQIAPKFEDTKWRNKLFSQPIRNSVEIEKTAIELAKRTGLDKNWIKELISDLKNPQKGLANTMLLNCPPNTSTAIYAGSSASVFPTFKLIQNEEKKKYVYQTFPRYLKTHLWYYEEYSKFDKEDLLEFIDLIKEIQKWIDSGISFEFPINHNLISTEELPETLIRFFYKAQKSGIKTLYYVRNILPVSSLFQENSNKEECTTCAN